MKKKRVLLLGATGMAGHMAYYYLRYTGKYEMIPVVYRTKLTEDSLVVDVTNKQLVTNIVQSFRPDIILNCVGILIKGSKDNPANAIYINAYFPHFLKELADKAKAKLIHISTDCVFSGKRGHYTVSDFRDADDIYGRSKALGEVIDNKDLTIRTSIVGPELKSSGEGLFHWFMGQTGTINGYTTAIWGGVTTLELAKAIDYAIENDAVGLVQLSNGIAISKYELLFLFKKIWKREDINIIRDEGNGVDKSILPSHNFDYHVPEYEKMLEQLHAWMKKNVTTYTQYFQS
jgi:dTDP-4-dehydrorhamnose reductase